MARIDRQRLVAARFPVTLEIPTRYDDVDMQGHVNNAAAVVILQEARAAFNYSERLSELTRPLRIMVASLSVDYAGEMHHPSTIMIDTGVAAIGRTSVTFAQVARQDGRTTLFAETVLVLADENGPAPIPAPLRAAYERLSIA